MSKRDTLVRESVAPTGATSVARATAIPFTWRRHATQSRMKHGRFVNGRPEDDDDDRPNPRVMCTLVTVRSGFNSFLPPPPYEKFAQLIEYKKKGGQNIRLKNILNGEIKIVCLISDISSYTY